MSSCCHERLGEQSERVSPKFTLRGQHVRRTLTVTCQLEDFGSEVLENSGEVDWKRFASQHEVEAPKVKETRYETHLEHQHQFSERSYPFSTYDEYDRLGTGDQPWKIWMSEP